MALSDVRIRNAKPGASQRKVYDTGTGAVPGLFVVVMPTGSRIFRLRFWLHGKERTLVLGTYPELALEAARQMARDARSLIAEGTDPVLAKRAGAAAKARDAENTFGALAERWIADGAWTPATFRQYRRMLDRDLLPILGRLPVAKIERRDVIALLDAASRRRKARDVTNRPRMIGGVIAARTAGLALAGILDLAVDSGMADANVARGIRRTGKARRRATAHTPTPYRSLSPDGLRDLLLRLDGYGGSPRTVAALRLQMLCLTRPSEARCARWNEFHLDAIGGPIWQLPANRMKARRPHDVPLSRQAITLLRGLHRLTGESEWLFPNNRDPKRPMGTSTTLRALEHLGADASPHGFRHTASTILHDQGFDSLVIERQLAHMDRNATRRAYNSATYLVERRRMLQHWADWLDQLKAGKVAAGNVVSIR